MLFLNNFTSRLEIDKLPVKILGKLFHETEDIKYKSKMYVLLQLRRHVN